jgi:hypothetical protein
VQNLSFLLLISLWGIQFSVSPSPQTVDHNTMQCWQPTEQRDIVINDSLSLGNLGLHMNLRFQLFSLDAKFSSSYLQFIPAGSRNERPTFRAHQNTIFFFRFAFICLTVTLQYLWLLTVEHKDRQCACNVTLGRVRLTAVAVVKQ